MNYKNILISRIDAIGDVTLTLPLCGYLKSVFPESKIFFLGGSYTESVIKTSSAVDHFINYNELRVLSEKEQISILKDKSIDLCIHVFPNKHISRIAKKSHIPVRIGTSHRWFHWLTCNNLVNLGRNKSNLHESELNLRLLKGIGITEFPPLDKIHQYYKFTNTVDVPENILAKLSKEKFNLILHPKSHGSGREWSLIRYKELIDILPDDKFNILISGSEKEKHLLKDWIHSIEKPVIDISGLMNLEQLIAFINKSDGLIACSTGPLHLAAALGIHTLGLYPNIRPIHAGRWGPVGTKAEYIESENAELNTISAFQVYQKIGGWVKNSC